MGSVAPSWQDKAEKKRQAVLDLIPPDWRLPLPLPSTKAQKNVTGAFVQQYLTPHEVEITESGTAQIVAKTTAGAWTATDVVTAFCHRAALAHQLTNCLHEIFFDQAIAEAARLDAEMAAGHGPAGPLHGLPVSFKDQFHVRGVETTMGYVGWIGTFEGQTGTGQEKEAESELVREVRALGGVPFCKTSLPHTVMSGETWNNIVGFTYNPHNRLMSCGGSSGGEGALLAMRGSPIGFGTDIGGSIRIPSAFNGLYGLRPSFGRVPYLGAANSMPGQNSIPSVCGPLAASPGALKLMLQAILQQEPWLHDEATELAVEAFTADGGIDIHHHIGLSGEPLQPRIQAMYGDKPSAPKTADALSAFNLRLGRYRKAYMDYWNSTAALTKSGAPVDAVLAPVAPHAALELGKALHIANAFKGYTPWVNTLDYTAVVFPVTKVDPAQDQLAADYEPRSALDKTIRDEYDPQVQEGTPVGLQLVGRRFQEEKVLALVEMLSDALAA